MRLILLCAPLMLRNAKSSGSLAEDPLVGPLVGELVGPLAGPLVGPLVGKLAGEEVGALVAAQGTGMERIHLSIQNAVL
jgi:hypothetical protein